MIKHVAIIPDGNRRYAKAHGLSISEVYGNAIEKGLEIARWCREEKIDTLTAWGFSTENWKRSKSEIGTLFQLFEEKAKNLLESAEAAEEIQKAGLRVRIIGDRTKLPKPLQALAAEIEKKTAKNKLRTLNILINYGGREEILGAVNRILSDGKKRVSEKEFSKYLLLDSEPDLIIRTSGEMRLSGLLPFQSTYSELYFSKKFFPEFEKADFVEAIEEFKRRKRRFGK
ncbi:MAG: polyprenyl diphosphate synthase [Candidatus Aenigmatarchaeota archaeon]